MCGYNKTYHITQFMCAPYLEKSKSTFLPWFIKRTDFNNFCTAVTGKKSKKTGHAFNLLIT